MYIILSKRDMIPRSRISVFLGQTEIDDVDEMGGSTCPHDKIGGFDIAVNVVFRVYEFDTGYLNVGNDFPFFGFV